jgi:hypothetical protein
MTEESKPATPRDALEAALGFRIEVRPDGEAGSVVWMGKTTVRPASGVEIKLWQALRKVVNPAGIPAHDVIDPFGTPKSGKSGGEDSGN